MRGTRQWIALEDCLDGYLYIIDARNGSVGVYDSKNQNFKLSRHKFSSNFIDTEEHWDWEGEDTFLGKKRLGTAKPLVKLTEAEKFDTEDELIKYLNDLEEELKTEIETAHGNVIDLFKNNNGVDERWIWNPKLRGSGIISCIPQKGFCPNGCKDCFFQSGRSYLEPLDKNLPHIAPTELAEGRIVRMNDGNDSNVNRKLVEETSKKYKDVFFNTAIMKDIGDFPGPAVVTVNMGDKTDTEFDKYEGVPPDNLMFVRIRTNTWNMDTVVKPAVEYYTRRGVAVVLTYMAYYTEDLPEGEAEKYTWAKRTTNSYWVLNKEAKKGIEDFFEENPLVYSCGYKGQSICSYCGTCTREYYNAKERMCNNFKRIPHRKNPYKGYIQEQKEKHDTKGK